MYKKIYLLKHRIKNSITKRNHNINRSISFVLLIKTFLYKYTIQYFKLFHNAKKKYRCLEIGPGKKRIEGFETLNTLLINETDYIGQLGYKLPFKDNCFDVVYLSHVLEHVFWHKTDLTVKELKRIIKPSGKLEIWVPDGLKIAQAFCDAEKGINEDYKKDGWYKYNDEKDPCIWFSGRMFTYGDGLTPNANNHFNVHLAAFSYRYLHDLLYKNGFINICKVDNQECRGYNHGWISLGITGTKP